MEKSCIGRRKGLYHFVEWVMLWLGRSRGSVLAGDEHIVHEIWFGKHFIFPHEISFASL